MRLLVLSGFSGAGRTILLHHRAGRQVATTTSERRRANANTCLASRKGSRSHAEERLVKMRNGCICCTLRKDLMRATKLARAHCLDYLLIECAGISEPLRQLRLDEVYRIGRVGSGDYCSATPQWVLASAAGNLVEGTLSRELIFGS